MAALQNRCVKQPDPDGGYHLHARQRVTGKKTAHNTQRVKPQTPPQKPGNSREKICQRRQMIKNRMQLMRLKLAFLDQIHDASDASQSERSIRHGRNRSMKFHPRIGRNIHGVAHVDRRNERKTLQQNHQRRGKGAHQGEAIQRTHQHVHQRYRPCQKNEDLKQVRQRTTTQRVTAKR